MSVDGNIESLTRSKLVPSEIRTEYPICPTCGGEGSFEQPILEAGAKVFTMELRNCPLCGGHRRVRPEVAATADRPSA